ncbi:MAG: dihydrolipoamide acetyltransferase family protein [Chloroflexota bacterium]
MPRPIRMPQPGQMTEECTVLEWFKQVGDVVSKGDVLFEIETDKSNMEVEAFDEGTLLRIDAAVGSTVPVDTVVAWIGQPGEAIPDQAAAAPASAAIVSPSAGTAQTARSPSLSPSQIGAYPSHAGAYSTGRRLAISPRASRVAAELGVDPPSVTGSGPGGRIVERDIRAATKADAATRTEGGEPLSRIRQVIARRLTESATTIPHYTVTVAIDMTGLVDLRRDLKSQGSPITVTDFIHAATVQALVELPLVNSRTDGQTLWRREQVHLGVAVSIPDGLLVPVIRDAQTLSVAGLHDRIATLVEAARSGSLGPDELSGSTFTVSNMGMYGVEQFSAIINPDESGILAVSSIRPEPAVIGDGIAIRQMMRATLSADHRLVDGELGARFLNAIRSRLEDAGTFRTQV